MLSSTNNFIYNQTIKNGLLLEDPNTGSGKSYYSCQAIYSEVGRYTASYKQTKNKCRCCVYNKRQHCAEWNSIYREGLR